MDALLSALLHLTPPSSHDLAGWWRATTEPRGRGTTTIERALLGGACADRLGFAFAGGYAEALHALVPETRGHVASLCATEEGGAHPRAIRTTLVADPAGGYRLSGHKRWATAASTASELLIIASTGTDDAGRNRLRAVRVRAAAPGVHLTATSAAFVPEIPHCEVMLDAVHVAESDVLPGDGYDDYLKPFRTVEDLHVHAALLGYLIGVARRHHLEPGLVERALALTSVPRILAAAARTSPATHLALAGLVQLTAALLADLEPAWAALAGAAGTDANVAGTGANVAGTGAAAVAGTGAAAEHARWLRDRPLLRVAATARTARRDVARAALLSPPAA